MLIAISAQVCPCCTVKLMADDLKRELQVTVCPIVF